MGIPIADAMEAIFHQQERDLLDASGASRSEGPVSREDLDLLSESEARSLTETIRNRLNGDVSMLLLEAHDHRAWMPLGHHSWEQYVRREFGLSRRRSYELLEHANVVRSIMAAAGMCGIPHIKPYTSSRLKPNLDTVLETIRQKASGLQADDVPGVVDGVLAEYLAHPKLMNKPTPATDDASRHTLVRLTGRVDPERLQEAIDYLASLPAVDGRSAEIRLPEATLLALPRAVRWLNDYAATVAVWPSSAASA
jgi:hypothetical protein